jgi:hypothetical protein
MQSAAIAARSTTKHAALQEPCKRWLWLLHTQTVIVEDSPSLASYTPSELMSMEKLTEAYTKQCSATGVPLGGSGYKKA